MASGLSRGGFQGLIVAMLFFGPLLAAFLLYYVPSNARPGGSTAYGELLDPIPTLPAFSLQAATDVELGADWLAGKWWLVYIAPERCDSTCATDLSNLRKIWMLVGAEQDRVGYALLTTGFSTAPDDIEGLITGWPVGPEADSALALMGEEDTEGRPLFIVDPHRNLVMRYPAEPAPQGVLNDLKRLLRLSRIG
jgi:hypothetical protein